MNYFPRLSLSCCLLVTLATAGVERSLAAAAQAAPLHLALGGQQDDISDTVFIEGLWPVLQREHSLWLLQGGWQRQQQRNLLNLGLGWRYSANAHWGLGYNLFYDQDTTQRCRRASVGAEVWWRTLTLSANHYLPINGWRPAHDVKDEQQRVARGYDVTLRGYLPRVPQLGASVRYARYFGDEVAWGSQLQRHKNPQQWRWGLDFTPIPLLTLAYHRQAGFSGQAEQQISAVFSYRFDLSLAQQVDPHQVALLHSAPGQRLARVSRERLMAVKYAKIAVPVVQQVGSPPRSGIPGTAAGGTAAGIPGTAAGSSTAGSSTAEDSAAEGSAAEGSTAEGSTAGDSAEKKPRPWFLPW